MAKFKANASLTSKSDPELVIFADGVLRAMTDNPAYRSPVPTLSELQEFRDSFAGSIPDLGNRNQVLAAVKNEKRELLIDLLQNLALYVTFASNGNRAIILTSGFPPSKEREPAGPLDGPTNVRTEYSNQSGAIYVQCKRIKHAYSFEAQYRLADGDWSNIISSSRAKILIEGLTPGGRYDFRIRGMGSAGSSAWGEVSGVIVI